MVWRRRSGISDLSLAFHVRTFILQFEYGIISEGVKARVKSDWSFANTFTISYNADFSVFIFHTASVE